MSVDPHDCIFFVENVPLEPNKTYGFNCFHVGEHPHYCPAIRYHKCRAFEKKMNETDVQNILVAIVENNLTYIQSIIFPFQMYEDMFRKYHEQYNNEVTKYIVSQLDNQRDIGGLLL